MQCGINLQPARQCDAVDHRRRNSGGHAFGAHCQRQGEGPHRGRHRPDRRQYHHDFRLYDACQYVDPSIAARRRGRLLPDRLDRAQRHFPLPHHGRDRAFRVAEARHRRCHQRPAPAAALDCIRLRRVLRGCFRVRHSGCDHRRGSDRPRLLAARSFRPVADRQHRAGRLWRTRYTDPGACLGHRPRPLHSRRDGRTAVAVLLAAGAVLGGVGVRRLERHEGRLAGDFGHRRIVRDPAIRDLELHQPMDCRHRRVADLDGLPDPVPESLAAERTLAVAGVARQGRIGGDDDDAESDGQDTAEPCAGFGVRCCRGSLSAS